MIPGPQRSPGEGNGKPIQNSCLENPMDKRDLQAIVYRAAKSRTWLKRLSIANIETYLVWRKSLTLSQQSRKLWCMESKNKVSVSGTITGAQKRGHQLVIQLCLPLLPFEFASFDLCASFIGCHAPIQSFGITDAQAWLQHGSVTVYFC